jgi:cobalamin synthase
LTAGAAGAVLGIMVLGSQYSLYAYLVPKADAPDEWYWLLALCLLAEVILVLWLSRIIYVRWARD